MQINRSTVWSQGLDQVVYAMNTSYCRITKHTPYELVFGQKPRSNSALLKDLPMDVIVDEGRINIEFEEPAYHIQLTTF